MSTNRAIAPAISEFPELTIARPTTVTLPNGATLHSLNGGEQPIAMMSVVYDGGYCDLLRPGALQLMTATIKEGTTRHSAEEVAETFDFNGAWFRVDASSHNVTVTLQALSKGASQMLPLVDEILRCPLFPPDKVESIKRKMVAQAELNQKKVSALAQLADRRLTFGANHPMATQIPTPEQIAALTRDDVIDAWRKTIASLTPQIYLAGQIADLETTVAELFGQRPPLLTEGINQSIIAPQPMAEHRATATLEGAMQSAVTITIPTIDRSNPDYIDLRLATIALGGYFGSRLMTNIREEKGLTYGISAGLLGHREGGMLTINSQTDPRYVDRLIEETLKELETLRTVAMEREELEMVRHYEMSALASTLDSPLLIMNYYITHQTVGTPTGYFAMQQRALQQVTAERLREVMQRHIDPSHAYITVAGLAN